MQPDNQQNDSNWTFRNESEAGYTQAPPQPQQPEPPKQAVTWTASEFIAHHKDPGWYAMVVGGALALCTVIYLVTRDLISVIAIAIVVVLFLVLSGNKPRQRSYSVDAQGIFIGDKSYPYSGFKSFAVSQEGAIGCITFMPLKRLMPELSIYYAPEDESRIIEVLITSLPNDQRKEQGVDRLAKRLRF